jgi:hypothetical protein
MGPQVLIRKETILMVAELSRLLDRLLVAGCKTNSKHRALLWLNFAVF